MPRFSTAAKPAASPNPTQLPANQSCGKPGQTSVNQRNRRIVINLRAYRRSLFSHRQAKSPASSHGILTRNSGWIKANHTQAWSYGDFKRGEGSSIGSRT
jgi:hypothetical protein